MLQISQYEILQENVRVTGSGDQEDHAADDEQHRDGAWRSLRAPHVFRCLDVAQATIKRVEKGDASVRLGVYAMTLFVLGFGDRIRDLIDAGRDETGLLLDQEERIPQRVRPKKTPQRL
jgi:hypothetical protein